jgi:transcriptional regulator with XRE-family HTH domain
MELKERIALIIKENKFKQKELGVIMGVSESYVSYILAGRKTNLSTAVANLIEEKLGYSAQWILTGEGDKLKQIGNNHNLSEEHKRAIMQLEKMSDEEIRATLAFIDSLEKIKKNFCK